MTTTYAPNQTTTRGHAVQINDIEMYYEEYGVGKPLVLLHGFGGCSQNWHPFTAKLSERHRLIVVDMRGHGYSTNPENKFTHREAARDVFLLLEKLGVGRFSAMGMSSGGMALLHMATSQPKRIDSMVLISATSHFPDQARAIMRRASFETMPQQVREMYRECAKRGDAQIRQLIAQFNALSKDYDDMNFTAQSLSAITARTLVVHGDRDHFFPVEIPVSIYRSIPDAALWIVPGGDHVPVFDSTVPFTSTALRFLEGPDSKQPSAA
ncbi:alpha/beta hydrolase [Corallococcus praedator]|uniref:Alpha/beta hydrolase n=1 Tax=Corallococcus praedator TaxID=2316724 RepID=A0ABX9QT27_9BACT|nr:MULTISPECIES: alpha/beta hydrolase [Corallococcus]RKH35253.1 alpha/beta hydrolase [Corallococcus sp. CA031C]RKI16416.1 alpha/beta hydrolase [Corallococcus praedator]